MVATFRPSADNAPPLLICCCVQAVQSGQLSADPAGVRGQLLLVLHDAFQRLRWLAAARGKLRDVRRLMQVDADTGAASACTPLVRQVLTKILLRVGTHCVVHCAQSMPGVSAQDSACTNAVQ